MSKRAAKRAKAKLKARQELFDKIKDPKVRAERKRPGSLNPHK